MDARQADALARSVADLVSDGQIDQACACLEPILAQKIPFRLLDRIGSTVGGGAPPNLDALAERIAAGRSMGGWVVIGSMFGQQLDRDLNGALERCRTLIMGADIWYAADILGERVPGPALVAHPEDALSSLASWREDGNRWVRRTVGVAVHYWAKRSRGAPNLGVQAGTLLDFLAPMLEEQDLDAVKGVGWGLKTLGRYYPELTAAWLTEQLIHQGRHPRSLMLRKARTYLPIEPSLYSARPVRRSARSVGRRDLPNRLA
jgi:hypothetical protein